VAATGRVAQQQQQQQQQLAQQLAQQLRRVGPSRLCGWQVVLDSDCSDVGIVQEVSPWGPGGAWARAAAPAARLTPLTPHTLQHPPHPPPTPCPTPQVVCVASAGAAPRSLLLRVRQPHVLAPHGYAGDLEHLIPLVPAIVPRLDEGARRVHLAPPPGLLKLGRVRLVLAFLAQALQEHSAPAPAAAGAAAARCAALRAVPAPQVAAAGSAGRCRCCLLPAAPWRHPPPASPRLLPPARHPLVRRCRRTATRLCPHGLDVGAAP
jgi:hypothetical protein